MDWKGFSRREFIKIATGASLCPLALARAAGAAESTSLSDHEALAYQKLSDSDVVCVLCPRGCIVQDGRRGYCRVRENQGGVYKTLVYGRPCTARPDPIEKKPLFHFLPGSRTYSIATAGCNLECLFCPNWEISQARPEEVSLKDLPPKKVVEQAQRDECQSIAYTYSEPVVFYEYMLDTARAANEVGIRSVMISNGYINPAPMKRLCEVLAAAMVELKAFTDSFYRRYVDGRLRPVLETILLLKELGVHTELATLLIPGLNDSEDEIKDLSRWVVKNLGADVPLHFTRFLPVYRMTDRSPTPRRTLIRARDIAVSEGVRYAYVGGLRGHDYESTYCHSCGKVLIKRHADQVGQAQITKGKCDYCATFIPGVWA